MIRLKSLIGILVIFGLQGCQVSKANHRNQPRQDVKIYLDLENQGLRVIKSI